jgi:hypothetical protein
MFGRAEAQSQWQINWICSRVYVPNWHNSLEEDPEKRIDLVTNATKKSYTAKELGNKTTNPSLQFVYTTYYFS